MKCQAVVLPHAGLLLNIKKKLSAYEITCTNCKSVTLSVSSQGCLATYCNLFISSSRKGRTTKQQTLLIAKRWKRQQVADYKRANKTFQSASNVRYLMTVQLLPATYTYKSIPTSDIHIYTDRHTHALIIVT